MPAKPKTKSQKLERSRHDALLREIKKNPLCVSQGFRTYVQQKKEWNNETADAAALVMHHWFMKHKKSDVDGWVYMPYQVFEGMYGAGYKRVVTHLICAGFLERNEKQKYRASGTVRYCSRFRICQELREEEFTASYFLQSNPYRESYRRIDLHRKTDTDSLRLARIFLLLPVNCRQTFL